MNLSSSAGDTIPPMVVVYGASKVTIMMLGAIYAILSYPYSVIVNILYMHMQSFVNSFSEGLRKEYTGKGIVVQVGL